MERAALQIADERTASEAMRPRRSKNKGRLSVSEGVNLSGRAKQNKDPLAGVFLFEAPE